MKSGRLRRAALAVTRFFIEADRPEAPDVVQDPSAVMYEDVAGTPVRCVPVFAAGGTYIARWIADPAEAEALRRETAEKAATSLPPPLPPPHTAEPPQFNPAAAAGL